MTISSIQTARLRPSTLVYTDARTERHVVVAVRSPADAVVDWSLQEQPIRSPWDAFNVRRLDDQLAHCAFLPTGPGKLSYPRGPLDVLNYTLDSLPLRETKWDGKTYFSLEEKLERAWSTLEVEISVLIHEACRVWDVGIPLEYDPKHDFRPSRYKYKVPDTDAYRFRRRANQARASFAVQLALFTMLLATTKANGLFDFRDLYQRTEVSPVFIDAISGCWAGDLNRPCVGTIVDATVLPSAFAKNSWYRNINNFLRITTELPLWFDYGSKPPLHLSY